MTRRETIETVASVLFGRSPDGGPEAGWVAKLARAMGVSATAIHKTLEKPESPVFDRKLHGFVDARIEQMERDLSALKGIRSHLDIEKMRAPVRKAQRRALAATNVLELVDALNAIEAIEAGASREIDIPQFAEAPDVDWNQWTDEPVSFDGKHIAWREQTGEYTWSMYAAVADLNEEEV